MRYARDLTPEEAATHPWFGRECPACRAAPGQPCRGSKGYSTLHGQRSIGSAAGWVDPRPRVPPHRDCPPCPDCDAPCGTTEDAPPGKLTCCACGHTWTGTAGELKQARRADAAYAEVRELEEAEQRWPEHMRKANRRMLDRPPQPARVAEQLELEVVP